MDKQRGYFQIPLAPPPRSNLKYKNVCPWSRQHYNHLPAVRTVQMFHIRWVEICCTVVTFKLGNCNRLRDPQLFHKANKHQSHSKAAAPWNKCKIKEDFIINTEIIPIFSLQGGRFTWPISEVNASTWTVRPKASWAFVKPCSGLLAELGQLSIGNSVILHHMNNGHWFLCLLSQAPYIRQETTQGWQRT